CTYQDIVCSGCIATLDQSASWSWACNSGQDTGRACLQGSCVLDGSNARSRGSNHCRYAVLQEPSSAEGGCDYLSRANQRRTLDKKDIGDWRGCHFVQWPEGSSQRNDRF